MLGDVNETKMGWKGDGWRKQEKKKEKWIKRKLKQCW